MKLQQFLLLISNEEFIEIEDDKNCMIFQGFLPELSQLIRSSDYEVFAISTNSTDNLKISIKAISVEGVFKELGSGDEHDDY